MKKETKNELCCHAPYFTFQITQAQPDMTLRPTGPWVPGSLGWAIDSQWVSSLNPGWVFPSLVSKEPSILVKWMKK